MSVAARIRKFLVRTEKGQLFTTRQFLGYGSRGAVDQTLYSLVKHGVIMRIARGVFMLAGSGLPSAFEVAKVKAAAFYKQVFQKDTDLASEFAAQNQDSAEYEIYTNGRSSSFRFLDKTILFIARSPRKLPQPETLSSQVVRTMWELGKAGCTQELIDRSYPKWSSACGELEKMASILPDWINRLFYWGRVRRRNLPWEYKFDFRKLFPEFWDQFKELWE
ncbi:MAG: type IV toxin-antitoxin system AbiEi family antitoxin domain-containing protein [Candidatus Obscuribacterales bacterium]|nr:type IV toxin-antitoxin system AbiEi family antitoxin domain-containing protein [Candidatus Obscuribacterales bacterium]